MTTPEIVVRDYLRDDDTLMGLLNGDETRLNLDWSGNLNATHITLYRAGGNQHDYMPLQSPVIVVHCYGSTRQAACGLGDQVAVTLRAASNANAPIDSASVESVIYLPTADGVARYIVTSVVTMHMALAA